MSSFQRQADEIVGLLTRAAGGVVDAHGHLHAPQGLGELSGRFIEQGETEFVRGRTWAREKRDATVAERVKRGLEGMRVARTKGPLAYVPIYREVVSQTLANKHVYRNGPHTITVDRDVSPFLVLTMAGHLDRLIEKYPPSGPVAIQVVTDAHMRRIYGNKAEAFASHGRPSMTFMETALRSGEVSRTIAHEYAHTFDVYGNGHQDLFKKFRADLWSDYGRKNRVEAFAEAFAEWDNYRGSADAGPAARAYAERYGWKRG